MDHKSEYNLWHKVTDSKNSSDYLKLSKWHNEAFLAFNDVSGKKVLEVGCGKGDFSLYLAEKGATIIGTDFSETAIEIATAKGKLYKSSATFLEMDAQMICFEDAFFDIIYSCECLEHIPDPTKALKEFQRVLKSGGIAIITTENYSNAMIFLWLKSWITKTPFNSGEKIQPIENFFVFWRVKKMMNNAGFVVKKITGWHYVFLILPRNINLILQHINNKLAKWLFKPFARHMTYLLQKK